MLPLRHVWFNNPCLDQAFQTIPEESAPSSTVPQVAVISVVLGLTSQVDLLGTSGRLDRSDLPGPQEAFLDPLDCGLVKDLSRRSLAIRMRDMWRKRPDPHPCT